ncbi:MAG: ATP-binding cassette domain-containing protein [Oscillospiraceae bacterium]
MTAIKLHELTKKFGDHTAVDSISFEVEKGELLGFLGVNGAGKSTTINMLSTLLTPDGGTAEICGEQLGTGNESIRRKIGIVYQQNCLDGILSVKENLICRGILHGATAGEAKKRLMQLSDILTLEPILKQRYASLSGGQKRRCEIAAALMHAPEVLFLDEPTTGLDPATRKDVWTAVESLRRDTGMTIFLTTHYMEEAAGANRIIIIDSGRLRASGTPFELKEKYACDTVKFYCDPSERAPAEQYLSSCGAAYRAEDYGFSLSVKNTTDSIDHINSLKEHITGFEVIQGTMDDVFLNACGKELKGENNDAVL